MNTLCIAGNIARMDEREINNANGTTKVMNVTVAVRRRFKNKDGNYNTDFFPMSFWGKSADFIKSHFKVGNGIVVNGSVERHKDKQGHWQTRFVPANVEFGNMYYNKGTVSGNVARLEEKDGNIILTIATRRTYKDKEGNYVTDFFSAFIFDEKQKELVRKYFPVGAGIILEYELRMGKNYSLNFSITEIRFGNRKKKDSDSTTSDTTAPTTPDDYGEIQTTDGNDGFVVIEDEEDLPF